MAAITLISDFGLKDHYVSSIKGALLRAMPELPLVDISHEIDKYDISSAAFLLRAVYSQYPNNTVHIIGVGSEYNATQGYVVVYHHNQYFIGANNGIFSLLFDETPERVVAVPVNTDDNLSFVARDIFVPIAVRLVKGEELSTIGQEGLQLIQRLPFRAASSGDLIKGTIIYIDSYENAITNIDKHLFDSTVQNKPFIIDLARGNQIDKISRDYSDVPEGEILAMFNSEGKLEIALRNGTLSSLLQLKLNDQINIHLL